MDDQKASGMENRIQFTTRNVLIATMWIAVWCAGVGAGNKPFMLLGPFVAQAVWVFLLIVPPAAAVGAMCDRSKLGLACGLSSFAAQMLWWHMLAS